LLKAIYQGKMRNEESRLMINHNSRAAMRERMYWTTNKLQEGLFNYDEDCYYITVAFSTRIIAKSEKAALREVKDILRKTNLHPEECLLEVVSSANEKMRDWYREKSLEIK